MARIPKKRRKGKASKETKGKKRNNHQEGIEVLLLWTGRACQCSLGSMDSCSLEGSEINAVAWTERALPAALLSVMCIHIITSAVHVKVTIAITVCPKTEYLHWAFATLVAIWKLHKSIEGRRHHYLPVVLSWTVSKSACKIEGNCRKHFKL